MLEKPRARHPKTPAPPKPNATHVQGRYLAQLVADETRVFVTSVQGVILRGVIMSFDLYTLVLRQGDGRQTLLYKHAIAQITPYSSDTD